jgi:hypothetical protein
MAKIKIDLKKYEKSWEVNGRWQNDLEEYGRWKRSMRRIKKIMRIYGK